MDIFVIQEEDNSDGETLSWQEVLIHGDPEGLRSLAKLLLDLADTDQDNIDNLPIGAREHIHLYPDFELSGSSCRKA